jgi:hypothetical protein
MVEGPLNQDKPAEQRYQGESPIHMHAKNSYLVAIHSVRMPIRCSAIGISSWGWGLHGRVARGGHRGSHRSDAIASLGRVGRLHRSER